VSACPTENNVLISATASRTDLKYCKDGVDPSTSAKVIIEDALL
jgi:hypothetical protein